MFHHITHACLVQCSSPSRVHHLPPYCLLPSLNFHKIPRAHESLPQFRLTYQVSHARSCAPALTWRAFPSHPGPASFNNIHLSLILLSSTSKLIKPRTIIQRPDIT
ncbi:uncharacterized protein MYCFIDRAFT_210976, partial [Pseudocercospora fijiensis CIRAD86]